MDEEANPVKEFLFAHIEGSQTIPRLIAERKFDEVIKEVTSNCYGKIVSMGKKDESIGVLAIGLLHYLLTNALITSQRKVEHDGVEIDIVVPDLKTLEKDPKKTLLICIPKSSHNNQSEDSPDGKDSARKRKHMGGAVREHPGRKEVLCTV